MKRAIHFAQTILVASLAAILAACGGGGGSADAPSATAPAPTPPANTPSAAQEPAPPTMASMQGLYEGTIGTRTAGIIVLPTGRYYVLYTRANDPQWIVGTVVGDLSLGAGGTTFTSANMHDFNLETMRVYYGNLAGTFVPKTRFAGTASVGAATTQFEGRYDAAYETQASLPAVAGNYTGQVGTQFGVESMTLNITAGGAITGSSQSGCNVSGAAGILGGNSVYTVRITYGSGCKLNGVTHTGHAVLSSGKLLRAVATAQDLSDAVIFIGRKP